jgi:MoaA/NifB/PqqE/SkfB family radical SAM enzyme
MKIVSDRIENTDPRFGFGGRLTSEFPSQVIVDVTEVCNLACIHCPHPEFKASEHYEGRYLSQEIHSKLIDEINSAGRGSVQYIRYTSNGEPLVHPGIYEMLDQAVKDSGTKVCLTTNGTILNEKRIRKLFASGLHLVDVSIDAFESSTYEKIRVKGNLEVTRSNVLNLIQIRNDLGAKTKIVVSFVEQNENKGEAEFFENFWGEAGVDNVVIRRLHSAAGGVPAIAESLKEHLSEQRKPCLYPWERILLNAAGQLAFCPQDWLHGSVVADYRSDSIADVWQGDFFRKLREAHLKNSFSDHKFCGNCPDWQQTRWPHEGRSYADLVAEIH